MKCLSIGLAVWFGFTAGESWAQKPNTLSPAEVKAGWRLLFDGKTTKGWAPNDAGSAKPEWKAEGGSLKPPVGPVCWYVNTTPQMSYEVTGEAWAENKVGAMVGVAESHVTKGGAATYS